MHQLPQPNLEKKTDWRKSIIQRRISTFSISTARCTFAL